MDKLLWVGLGWVGLGGALGAILRYSISLLPLKSSFPFLTLITNVIGAFVIGIVVGLFEKHYLSSNINLFLKTGVCGGFTTFSTFSLETLTLLENGMPSIAMIYAFVSIIGCVIGVYLGKTIVGIRAL